MSWWHALTPLGKALYIALWVAIIILFLWGIGVFQ